MDRELWIHKPDAVSRGDVFEAQRIGGAMLGRHADPLLNIDHFKMRGPTFPPHAHAGFSAVTYLLPESPAGMRNLDSRGDRSLIGPGGIHWTAAGAGLVHEEVPDPDGVTAEGMQIFIRQPVAQEAQPPVIHHIAPEDVPVVAIGPGAWIRVLAGRLGGVAALFTPPSPLQLLDVALSPGARITWGNSWADAGVTLYLFSGAIDLGAVQAAAPAVLLFGRGTETLHIAATIGDARLLLFSGEPIDAPAHGNGAFLMSSQAALDSAVARYARGDMGRIPTEA